MSDLFRVEIYAGLGDSLCQKHLVEQLAKVKNGIALSSPWWQFWWNSPGVNLWYRDVFLRTQEENMDRAPKEIWAPIHRNLPYQLHISYDNRYLKAGMTMAESFAKKVETDAGIKIDTYDLHLDIHPTWLEKAEKILSGDYAVIRMPTYRSEWGAVSRNPELSLMPLLVKEIQKQGLKVVSISYNSPLYENFIEDFDADLRFEHGELTVDILAAVVHKSKLFLTSVGFGTFLGPAVGAPTFNVAGGHVAMKHILDPRIKGKYTYIEPEIPCNCFIMDHACNKHIDKDFALTKLREFMCQS